MAAPRTVVLQAILDDGGTAGTNADGRAVWPGPGQVRIVNLSASPETAITADDSNYTDISAEVVRSGASAVEIASEQTTTSDTGNISAGQGEALAITSDPDELILDPGDTVIFKSTKAGTGVAHNQLACGCTVVEFRG